MLKECTERDVDLYADFAYELAMDLKKSAYPTYCDGMKTKEMFIKQLRDAYEDEYEENLLFEYEGKIEGIIQYYWIPEEKYIQTEVFNINKATKQAIAEFLEYVGERLKGYDLYLGFPRENEAAIDCFEELKFRCIESDYDNIAFVDKLGDIKKSTGVIRINKDNFESFRVLHSQNEEDMYWTSDRILEDLDNWNIFVKEKNETSKGAIFYTGSAESGFEIFGTDMNNNEYDEDLFKDLLYAVLADVKAKGGRFIGFFSDEEAEKATLECGFVLVGEYRCYKAHLE